METNYRGSGLLVVVSIVLMIGVGAFFIFRKTRSERPASIIIFHRIPGPGPLQIIGTVPFTSKSREDAGRLLDRDLLDRLQHSGMTGELRMVAEIPIDPRFRAENSGLVLDHLPVAPVTLNLVDAQGGVYSDQEPGLLLLPKDAINLGPTITLTPDITGSGNVLPFRFTDPKGKLSNAGMTRIFWW